MKQFPGEWFRYVALEGGSAAPARPAPILQIMLTHGSRSRSAFALIDTGAEVSVLPRGLAQRLGITVGPPDTSIATLGGDVPATRIVAGLRISLTGRPIDIPAADLRVPERDDDSSLVILGRHPLLLKAELRVQEWRQRFALVTRRRAWLPDG